MSDYKNYDLYTKVVEITSDYLGPASRRFIDRQVINHLGKEPEEITDEDLKDLIKWIEAATALLTDDTRLVREFKERLESLNNNRQTAG